MYKLQNIWNSCWWSDGQPLALEDFRLLWPDRERHRCDGPQSLKKKRSTVRAACSSWKKCCRNQSYHCINSIAAFAHVPGCFEISSDNLQKKTQLSYIGSTLN